MGKNNLYIFFLAVVFMFGLALFSQAEDWVDCWDLKTENDCITTGANQCVWDNTNSQCYRPDCASMGDWTNDTFCNVTMKTLYNLSCNWGINCANCCDPNASATVGGGGNFYGSGCSDYNGNADNCYGSGYCEWNAAVNICNDSTDFSFSGGMGGGFQNPSCMGIMDQNTCQNISGCTWTAAGDWGSCAGNNAGIMCSYLNKTLGPDSSTATDLCNDFTLLSTCCTWNGTSCTTTFSNECYSTMTAMPAGATYCEDYNSFTNQTLCEQMAGSPWYMPCKWDNTTNECHFNDFAFGGGGFGGGFGGFDEMGTQKGCEAQAGVWKTEQWVAPSGAIKTDSWCEFNFGSGGNCDASCWACENSVTSLANAQTTCEDSALGYCEFTTDSWAMNGYGWCVPKMEFIEGGGKSCKDDCASCDFLTNPQSMCQNSTKGCVWEVDTDSPNGVGYCYGNNEKRCGNDCFSCYTAADCGTGNGGSGACTWDPVSYICKSSGFTGEICFDGKDNDADTKIDCLDADCAADKFCGGAELSGAGGFGDCPSFSDKAACDASGCNWMNNTFDQFFGGDGADAGYCDFPGAQCMMFDEDSSACDAVSGCSYSTMGSSFCVENNTLFNACFPQTTAVDCAAVPGCGWVVDSYNTYSGRCEPLAFAQCFGNTTRHGGQTACEVNATVNWDGNDVSTKICSWTSDPYSPQGGYCDPVCFGLAANSCTSANTHGLCKTTNGFCEPDSFGGKCYSADGNRTWCVGTLNQTCTWVQDAGANNNVTNVSDPAGSPSESGWCNSKMDMGFVNFMGDMEPIVLGTDISEPINWSYDIESVGLRDEFDKIIFGTKMYDYFGNSSVCNGSVTYWGGFGGGHFNHTFFWYVDSDGDTTNNCAARDNASQTGFEFSFKYQGGWLAGSAELKETKVSYRCINGNWGPVPIPLTSNKQVMCSLIGGGMAGVEKTELFKFKTLYNKSKDLRIYATVTNRTDNDSKADDSAGPFYYSQGAFDFKFEDCGNPGADQDGDGLKASNDPDCFDFMKFGFVPQEGGFQCGDGIDNDADEGKIGGGTDCEDDGCKYDPFICGGNLVADANDKTAPKITWLKKSPFPDSVFVMYDTNEPSNGTLDYYFLNKSCMGTINKTIRDVGIFDTFMPAYKIWHDGPIDTFSFNPERISKPIPNATTIYFKIKVCDISGNCAVSACLNTTTKATFANCKSCKSTFNFPFTPPSGVAVTDPLGDLKFSFKFQDGTQSNISSNAAAGTQLNYTQTKNFDIVIENPTAANATNWKFTLVNASVTGKVATGIQNFSGGADIMFNSTTENGSFIGLGNTKCQELLNTFRPKKLQIGIPGNHTDLWQCTYALANCTNKTSNATRIRYNATANITEWQVPAEWGC